MSIITQNKLENKTDGLQDQYWYKAIPAGLENVAAAYFNLQEVKDLISALPNEAQEIKVILVLDDYSPSPNSPVQKKVSMAMVGTRCDNPSRNESIFANLNNDGNNCLLAHRTCPTDCDPPRYVPRYITGAADSPPQ